MTLVFVISILPLLVKGFRMYFPKILTLLFQFIAFVFGITGLSIKFGVLSFGRRTVAIFNENAINVYDKFSLSSLSIFVVSLVGIFHTIRWSADLIHFNLFDKAFQAAENLSRKNSEGLACTPVPIDIGTPNGI